MGFFPLFSINLLNCVPLNNYLTWVQYHWFADLGTFVKIVNRSGQIESNPRLFNFYCFLCHTAAVLKAVFWRESSGCSCELWLWRLDPKGLKPMMGCSVFWGYLASWITDAMFQWLGWWFILQNVYKRFLNCEFLSDKEPWSSYSCLLAMNDFNHLI